MHTIFPSSSKHKKEKIHTIFSLLFFSNLRPIQPWSIRNTMIACVGALIICQGQIQLKILLNIPKINYAWTWINHEYKMDQMFRGEWFVMIDDLLQTLSLF